MMQLAPHTDATCPADGVSCIKNLSSYIPKFNIEQICFIETYPCLLKAEILYIDKTQLNYNLMDVTQFYRRKCKI